MKKVEVDVDTFKALTSEERILLLKTMDKKKHTVQSLCKETNLSEENIRASLVSLKQAGFIKQKTSSNSYYYTLSWKGSTLLHPENNRVFALASITLASLCTAFIGLTLFIRQQIAKPVHSTLVLEKNDSLLFAPRMGSMFESTSQSTATSPYPSIIILSVVVFLSLLFICAWRYNKNKKQRL